MYSHDSPPQQPEVPHYDAPFLPGANAAPSPMAPPPVAPSPGEKKTTQSRLKPPFLPEVQKTKTPPIPRTSQRALSPRRRRRGVSPRFKIMLALAVVLILAIGGFASYQVYSSFHRPAHHPAQTVIQKFYQAMKKRDYQTAYSYVSKNGLRGSFLTLPFTTSNSYHNAGDFAKDCQTIDAQVSTITNFSITNFSVSTIFNDPVTASITVDRGKQTYSEDMGLVQEGKDWKIDYVDNLCSNLNPT